MTAAARAAEGHCWLPCSSWLSFRLAFAALSAYATTRADAGREAPQIVEANFTEFSGVHHRTDGHAVHAPSLASNRNVLIRNIGEVIQRSRQCMMCRPRRGRDVLLRALDDAQNSAQLIQILARKNCLVWNWGNLGFDLATVQLLLEMAAYAGERLYDQFRTFLGDFIVSHELDVLAFFQDSVSSTQPIPPNTFAYTMTMDLKAASEQFQQPRHMLLKVAGERAQYQRGEEEGNAISARDQLRLWFRVGAVSGSPCFFGCFVDVRVVQQNQVAFAKLRAMLEPLARRDNFLMVGMMRGGFYLSKLMDTGFIGSRLLKVEKVSGQGDPKELHIRRAIQDIVYRFNLRNDRTRQVDAAFLDAYMGGLTSAAYARVIPGDLLAQYPNVRVHLFWIREQMHLRRTEPARPGGPLAPRYLNYVEDVNWILGDDMPCIVEEPGTPITKQPFRIFNAEGRVQTFSNERDEDISLHHLKRSIWGVMARLVTVRIIRARGLRNIGSIGIVDPHCVIRVGARFGGQVVSTSIKQNTQNPVWNEDLTVTYDIALESMRPYLEFMVLDGPRAGFLGSYVMGSEFFLRLGALSLQLGDPSAAGGVGTLDVQIMSVQDAPR